MKKMGLKLDTEKFNSEEYRNQNTFRTKEPRAVGKQFSQENINLRKVFPAL